MLVFGLNPLELELEFYFYLNTVNLSDKIIIKITIYFTLYKHDLKISIVKIASLFSEFLKL